jgi:hypothetical protein
MEHSSEENIFFWNQSYDLLGTFTYIIMANDTSENLASVTGTFLIRDTTPPVISNLEVNPGLQKRRSPLIISCNVSDNYELYGLNIEITNPDGIVIDNISTRYNSTYQEFQLNQSYNASGVYTFTIRVNDLSDNWVSTTGSFEIEKEEDPDDYNWKPIIALIFTCILLIAGIIVVRNKPMKYTGDLSRDRTYSFLAGVLPFVVAEAITGLISFFTGFLAVPPIIGLGMIVDLVILIVGLIVIMVIYKKGIPADSYVTDEKPPSEEPQQPPKTPKLNGEEESIASGEAQLPSAPPEIPPPIPPPPDPEDQSPPIPESHDEGQHFPPWPFN